MNVKAMVVDRVALCVHNENDPTDEEWKAVVSQLEREQRSFDNVVAVTLGGSLSATQRKAIRGVLKGVRRNVVITDSSLVRGAVTALGWLGVKIEAFPLSDIRSVFESLASSKPAVDQLLGAVESAFEQVAPHKHIRNVG